MIRWTITVADIDRRISELLELEKTDRAAAGAGANELRADVLEFIADGIAADPRALARAAMRTIDLNIGG